MRAEGLVVPLNFDNSLALRLLVVNTRSALSIYVCVFEHDLLSILGVVSPFFCKMSHLSLEIL